MGHVLNCQNLITNYDVWNFSFPYTIYVEISCPNWITTLSLLWHKSLLKKNKRNYKHWNVLNWLLGNSQIKNLITDHYAYQASNTKNVTKLIGNEGISLTRKWIISKFLKKFKSFIDNLSCDGGWGGAQEEETSHHLCWRKKCHESTLV